ncbi:DUF4174 domain-containing protein [Paracoccus aerodenitrificans]|uniref:DUF4174 domain-containing protein n=1 Tax=Paracoccus aerodenitrificans TaxID=3017781 RepID=UPI0022EFEB19|nr:DUF4174 domain-containing protein [Paracoccus aerodenitrificans]WBU63065.1 DUF4174 domain-containing protein [Paracoccus aerodenitrificans]
MRKTVPIIICAIMVAAMGSGGDPSPPSRVNPPSPAEVDAAQSGNTAMPDPGEDRILRILPASESEPGEFLWQARPVVVFADTAADPSFVLQLDSLRERPEQLIERDVVVITDTDPSAETSWRRALHPKGFSLVIMDKDGQVKQRKPAPWSVREISRAIDKFPLRREEIGRAGIVP